MVAEPSWPGIRERVLAVTRAEERARHFSFDHPALAPVLSESEIAEVEAQYGFELPEEYRSFLAEVGAGGEGPKILLTTLSKIDGRWGWVSEDDVDHAWYEYDAGPFVESDGWLDVQVATLHAAGHESGDPDVEDDYYADYLQAFGYEDGNILWDRQRNRGAIYLSDDGCGATGWLIVAGPCSGQVRERDCGVNPPYEPVLDVHGDHRTFRPWYLDWLAKREAEFADHLAD